MVVDPEAGHEMLDRSTRLVSRDEVVNPSAKDQSSPGDEPQDSSGRPSSSTLDIRHQQQHSLTRRFTWNSTRSTDVEEPPFEQTYPEALYETERIAAGDPDKDTIKDEGESVFSSIADPEDPFLPFPIEPHLPEEKNVLSFRALFIGCLLGALVNASNVYLGTWSQSASAMGDGGQKHSSNASDRFKNWLDIQRQYVWCYFWFCLS